MWWCPECKVFLEWDEVTFQETHDERAGGCGEEVLPERPDPESPDCQNGRRKEA